MQTNDVKTKTHDTGKGRWLGVLMLKATFLKTIKILIYEREEIYTWKTLGGGDLGV